MRRQIREFRPWLSDILEARAVPATLGVTTPIGLLGISVSLPSQVPTTSPQVQKAFATFDQSYIKAVDTILFAPSTNGVTVPTANRSAFDSAIEQSLETLAQQLVLSLTTTSTSTATSGSTSTTSNVSNQVVAAIVGTSSTSLESQLLAVSTSTIELDLANVTSVGTTSSTLLSNIASTVEQVRPTNRVPDTETTGLSTFSTDPTSTSSSSSSSTTKAANDVRSAFGNFLNDYFQAVQNTLLAPGSNGQASPTANRAAFNAEVNQAIQTLETRLSTTLSRYPATTGLGPQIQTALEGSSASSLKTQLTSLATPTSTQASVVRDFTLGSTQAIAQALSLITGDVASALSAAGK